MLERIQEAEKDDDKVEVASYYKKLITHSIPVEAILNFNRFSSSYHVIKNLESDKNKNLNPVLLRAGNNQKFFRSLKLNKNAFLSDALGSNYLVVYKDVDYEITSETKIIQGYKCFKAIRKDKSKPIFVAWFTFDLPFSFGPKEIHSLPGLVLQYDDGIAFTFKVKKIKLSEEENTIEQMPDNIDEISFEEYQKRLRKNMPEF